MLGVSLNWVICSTPSRSSPFAMVFLHERQLARPDFASSITFAMAGNLPEHASSHGTPSA